MTFCQHFYDEFHTITGVHSVENVYYMEKRPIAFTFTQAQKDLLSKLNATNLNQWNKMTANQTFVDSSQRNSDDLTVGNKKPHRIPSVTPSTANSSPDSRARALNPRSSITKLLDIDGHGDRSAREINKIRDKASGKTGAMSPTSPETKSQDVGDMFVRHYMSDKNDNYIDDSSNNNNKNNKPTLPKLRRNESKDSIGSSTRSRPLSSSKSSRSLGSSRGVFKQKNSFETVYDTVPNDVPPVTNMRALGVIALMRAKLHKHRERIRVEKEQLKAEFTACTPIIKNPVKISFHIMKMNALFVCF